MKRLILLLSLLSALVIPVTMTTPAAALFGGLKTETCKGVNLNNNDCAADSGSKIDTAIADGLNIFSIIVGVIAVIMVIFGGLKFILARGESANVSSARNTVLYAIIGLVIAGFAQIIVRFVLDRVQG